MSRRLIDLVRNLENGDIQLPLMQRDYVWTPRKLICLLDSLYRGWPIGSFYVWRPTGEQRTKTKIPHYSPVEFFGYLLDGQQRLVSLSRAMKKPADGESAFCAYFDVITERFVTASQNKTIQKRIQDRDPTLIALCALIMSAEESQQSHLVNIGNIITNIIDNSSVKLSSNEVECFRSRLLRVSKILDEHVPCEEFKNDHLSNAIELFARLNRGGTRLSAGEVEAAKLSQEATSDILPEMREFVQDKRLRQLGLDFLFVLRALVTVHRDNCSFAKLPSKWATSGVRDLRTSWRHVCDAVLATVEMISGLGWTTRTWLPSGNALIPVVYYLSIKANKPTHAERKALCLFLLRASVRSLFSGSVESTINRYVNVIARSESKRVPDVQALLRAIPKSSTRPIRPEQIRTERGMYSPLMQIYLAYLVSKQSLSWVSQRPLIDIASGGVQDPLSVHHIFPKEFLIKNHVNISMINSMANYAILAQSDNSALGETDPRDGYNSLTWEQRKHAAEQLCFHADDKFLTIEAYEEYVDHRSKELSRQLNAFLGFR